MLFLFDFLSGFIPVIITAGLYILYYYLFIISCFLWWRLGDSHDHCRKRGDIVLQDCRIKREILLIQNDLFAFPPEYLIISFGHSL